MHVCLFPLQSPTCTYPFQRQMNEEDAVKAAARLQARAAKASKKKAAKEAEEEDADAGCCICDCFVLLPFAMAVLVPVFECNGRRSAFVVQLSFSS